MEDVAVPLFEPAALALKAMALAEFIEPNPGPASRFEIQVRPPVVTHTVTVGQVRRWIESGSSDPRVAIKKARLAEMLAATSMTGRAAALQLRRFAGWTAR